MFDKIKNIDPEKITDLSEIRKVLNICLNVIESQTIIIEKQGKEIQELKDEINRMKGEHGSYEPRYPKLTSDLPKKKPNRKKGKRGSKKAKLEIDKVVKCEIDKSLLPADAKLHCYKNLVQQDLLIQRINTLFKVPVYYSRSTGQTYCGTLPPEYAGQFGSQLKSAIQLLHHFCDTTHGRLAALFKSLGVIISTGTINNVLLCNSDVMKKESEDILRAGLEAIGFTQMDETKTFEAGQAKATQVICTSHYTVYQTMDSKSRAHVIAALQGRVASDIPLLYDEQAIQKLKESQVPAKDQRIINQLLELGKTYTLVDFELLLEENAPHLLKKESHSKVLAILALRYYKTQTDFPVVENLLTDAGLEYKEITAHQGLCWLHEERHYKKMVPKFEIHQKALALFRGQIWGFYEKLLNFKERSAKQQKRLRSKLAADFDSIFTQQTNYKELDKRIKNTFSRKEKLLRVLYFPDLPLHNNIAELAIRRKVRKRDISLHTMSAQGTKSQDAFMSVVETAAKLGVNALDYLHDRITGKYLMPSLAELLVLKTN